jgi:hypothetical protein
MKKDKLHLTEQLENNSATITMSQIRIKNYRNWDQTSHLDFTNNNRLGTMQHRLNKTFDSSGRSASTTTSESNVLTLDTRVQVTYHEIRQFTKLQELCRINNFDFLYESLCPKFNRDMVFKAGEGAGRSGSFFFFSHDNRFIIKTLTKGELEIFLTMLPSYV